MTPVSALAPWQNFRLRAYQELGMTRCRCGQPKRLRQALCHDCFVACPLGIRMTLYHAAGYPRTYWRALQFLHLLTPEEKALEVEVIGDHR